MGPLGGMELIIILAILILLFGAKKIPDLARGLGEGIRNFKSGMREEEQITGKKDSEGQAAER
ncbi:preprotein translocase subunit TatA [Acidobacteria bacterium Mor1]|nr:preprotein translocase subunit TatA [Acidobacteria bacterium Mor1]